MHGRLLIIELTAAVLAASCSDGGMTRTTLAVKIECAACLSKTIPDVSDRQISDVNLYVFNVNGLLEEHIWADGSESIPFSAVEGENYSLYAFCNAGYRMSDMTEGQLEEFRYHMSTPYAYSKGMPMAGKSGSVTAVGSGVITLTVERLMSRISLRIDRSGLDRDVELYVHTVKTGNCPSCASPFASRPLSGHSETFASGFCRSGDECSALNSGMSAYGMSGEEEFFILENPADTLDPDTCPYIELQMDYLSDLWYTTGNESLIYRFYIRENDSYRIERNCHYRVTVTPHADGLLCDDSWRVDKSGLYAFNEEYSLKISPEGSWVDDRFYSCYYTMEKNSSLHFDIETVPKKMEVRLREDLVEDELDDGRAEYIMDDDGRGFTVRSLDRSCLSTMEIIPGSPLDEEDAVTIVIEIS